MNAALKPLILVVEDEADLVTLLSYNLEREGFRVITAGDGEEALLLADERSPHLILLDWMLPLMSGLEVCRQLRRNPKTRETPVIMLTARAEGFLRGKPDLDDVIKRLKSFEAAGADVLMAPGLPDLDAVRKVCGSLGRPFNFMVGIKGRSFTKADLQAAGVKRISLATSLYRAAMTGLLDAAKEVKEQGTFSYLDHSIATPDLNAFMKE